MELKRGDVVLVAAPGDFGKPRPAVVVQTDLLNTVHETLAVCLMTSDVVAVKSFRVLIQPREDNGLHVPSQIMVDKIIAVKRTRIKKKIGALLQAEIAELNFTLRFCLGLVD